MQKQLTIKEKSFESMIGFIEGVLDWVKRDGKLSIHQQKAVDRAIKYCNNLKEKPNEEDYAACVSCDIKIPASEDAPQDDAGNYFCGPCWQELAPVMKAQYEELKKNGELE